MGVLAVVWLCPGRWETWTSRSPTSERTRLAAVVVCVAGWSLSADLGGRLPATTITHRHRRNSLALTHSPRFVECEPDVLRVPMRPLQASGSGDAFVILGSDGLWDVLSDEDAVHCCKRALQVGSQGSWMVDAAALIVWLLWLQMLCSSLMLMRVP